MYSRGANRHEPHNRISALRDEIAELRLNLEDTRTLIDELSRAALAIENNLAKAEREYARLLQSN